MPERARRNQPRGKASGPVNRLGGEIREASENQAGKPAAHPGAGDTGSSRYLTAGDYWFEAGCADDRGSPLHG